MLCQIYWRIFIHVSKESMMSSSVYSNKKDGKNEEESITIFRDVFKRQLNRDGVTSQQTWASPVQLWRTLTRSDIYFDSMWDIWVAEILPTKVS